MLSLFVCCLLKPELYFKFFCLIFCHYSIKISIVIYLKIYFNLWNEKRGISKYNFDISFLRTWLSQIWYNGMQENLIIQLHVYFCRNVDDWITRVLEILSTTWSRKINLKGSTILGAQKPLIYGTVDKINCGYSF